MRIGVIADTHGLVRPEALVALAGSALILHAGDVGAPEVLAALARIAPVRAVRGNNDRGAWANALPPDDTIDIAGHAIYLLHDVKELDVDPVAAGFAAVVAGHSHRPRNQRVDDVLYFNPGSAGPRRFSLPITVGRIDVDDSGLSATVIDLS
jgi:putative phosphoesterase